MAKIVVKNGHQKHMSYNEIGLLAQTILIVLGTCVDNRQKRNLHFDSL